MHLIDADQLEELLDFTGLIDAIRVMFAGGCESPTRHHHTVATPSGGEATLLLMPAWQIGAYMGVKMVTIYPENRELPSVMGQYVLMDAGTGEPLALLDGTVLTRWRTAATSALAATYLARGDATRMLMVGAGSLAPYFIRAYTAALPIREVKIWSRTPARAQALAASIDEPNLVVEPAQDLESAARGADIISCATLSHTPLIKGAWLSPGCHLDLVGAFRADMRESDDEAMRRASLYVDTFGGALAEGGDILQAIESGAISKDDIHADLHALTVGRSGGRTSVDEITAFKSVGAALEDLAAARLAFERLEKH